MKRRLLITTGVVFLVSGFVLLVCSCFQSGVFETVYYRLFKSCVIERDITYDVADGVSLKMDIYHPANADMPAPAVLYIHGGGWYSGDKTDGAGQFDIPEIIERGYVVASMNYRLAPRYKFPAQIDDVRSAIRFLRENADNYDINPDSIGVFGDSAGGHLAALTGVTCNETQCDNMNCGTDCNTLVQAVVDIYGPTDLSAFALQNSPMHMEHVFGCSDPDSRLLKEASPLTYVSVDAAPFLIIHGDKDTDVPLDQSVVFYQHLINAGVPASLVVIDNCGHGFVPIDGDINPERQEITGIILDFFDTYLKLQVPASIS